MDNLPPEILILIFESISASSWPLDDEVRNNLNNWQLVSSESTHFRPLMTCECSFSVAADSVFNLCIEKWCSIIRDIVIDIDGFTALAKHGTQEIVLQQLTRLTDCFPDNLKPIKAIHDSAYRGHDRVVSLMLEKGAEV